MTSSGRSGGGGSWSPPLASTHSLTYRSSKDAAAVLVVLPPLAGQIAAGHALDRDDLGPPDQHGPPGQPVAVLPERLGERRHVGRDQVIGRHVLGLLEPVQGQPRQYPALVRDG